MRYIQTLLSVMFLSCALAAAPAGLAQTSLTAFTTIDPAGATSTWAAGIYGSTSTTGGGTGTGGTPCYQGHQDSGEGQGQRAEDSGQRGEDSGDRAQGSGDDQHYKGNCGKSDPRSKHDKKDEARDSDDKAQPQGSGSGSGSGTPTSGSSVIVGYFDNATGTHGFQLVGTALPSAFDVPVTSGTYAGTYVTGVNGSSQMVGYYYVYDTNMALHVHGFVRSATGSYSTLDECSTCYTYAVGINGTGQVVGYYYDANFAQHGFLWSGGTFTNIDYPNIAFGTFPTGINSAGQIAGYYYDTNFSSHGFLAVPAAGGTFTFGTHDVPSTAPWLAISTFVNGINTAGDLVGYYYDSSFAQHGFKMLGGNPNSTTNVDIQGAIWTNANGINDAGVVVGEYSMVDPTTGLQKQHGFRMP